MRLNEGNTFKEKGKKKKKKDLGYALVETQGT